MSIRVLIAGGGTSGHVNPALAIAEAIRRRDPDAVIEFCGTERGIESDIVPRGGFVLHPIRARGIPTRPSVKMIRAFRDMWAGRRSCIALIRDFHPDIVIGTGGYVCTPLVSAANKMKVPVLLHEQNAFPGRSNRMMSRKAAVVCTSFEDAADYFSKARSVVFTGNPVRRIFFQMERETARRELGLAEDTFFLFAMGGSLGARTVNQSILAIARNMPKRVKIVLSAGKQQFAELSRVITGDGIPDNLEIREYIYNPEVYMAAADLILSRAGAITCAEIAALGVPSIMIPYPFAAGDHQTFNARSFEKRGACVIIKDEDVSAESLLSRILPLTDDSEQLRRMGRAASALAVPDADERIVDQVFQTVLKKGQIT